MTFTGDVEADKLKEGKKRIFGIGKGAVLYMSPDFNDRIDELKDYM